MNHKFPASAAYRLVADLAGMGEQGCARLMPSFNKPVSSNRQMQTSVPTWVRRSWSMRSSCAWLTTSKPLISAAATGWGLHCPTFSSPNSSSDSSQSSLEGAAAASVAGCTAPFCCSCLIAASDGSSPCVRVRRCEELAPGWRRRQRHCKVSACAAGLGCLRMQMVQDSADPPSWLLMHHEGGCTPASSACR